MDIQNLVATNFTILKEEQLMKKTKSMMKKITYLMTMLMTSFCMRLQVFAAKKESTTSDYDFSWLTKGEGNQSFSKVQPPYYKVLVGCGQSSFHLRPRANCHRNTRHSLLLSERHDVRGAAFRQTARVCEAENGSEPLRQ